MWYRIFGLTAIEIQPAELLDHLQRCGLAVQAHHFRGDEEGWFEAELVRENLSLTLSRFLATEQGVRSLMNTWAAWVEEQENNSHRDHLMAQMIGVQQVFVMDIPDHGAAREPLGKLALELCRFLAGKTGGFYQIDEQGFFSSEGGLLMAES